MIKVLPSQAAKVLDDTIKKARWDGTSNYQVNRGQVGTAAQILAVLSAVPDELIPPDETTRFLKARAALSNYVELGAETFNVKNYGVLRDVLAKCPDQVLPIRINALAFVTDSALRESLRGDLASVDNSMRTMDWKAATVIAGSAAEALLLWKLAQQDPAAVRTAAVTATATGFGGKPPSSDLNNWGLPGFVEVACSLNLIHQKTADQLKLVKFFRNLIHPGAAIREQFACNKGTAHAAVAGLEFVIVDFT